MPSIGPGTGPRLATPLDLPFAKHLVADWDSSFAPSLDHTGGTVATWRDLSGRGNHLTGAGTPTIGTRNINGVPCMDTDSNDTFTLPGSIMGTALSGTAIYTMADDNDPATGDATSGAVLESWGSSGQASHEPYSDSNIYHDFGTTARKTVGNPTPSMTVPHVISITTAPSLWQYRIDGSLFFSTATNTVGWGASPTVARNPGGFVFDGRIGRILIFNVALPINLLVQAELLLAGQWRIPHLLSACSPPLIWS